MTKDLILFNPEKETMSLKQLKNIMRDISKITQDLTLSQVLSIFQKDQVHIALITEIITEEDKDPFLKIIGVVTMEDIVEAILDTKIQDEHEHNELEKDHILFDDIKRQKEKLISLFLEKCTGDELHEHEIDAISQFLSQFVKPFRSSIIDSNFLRKIVREGEVFDIKSDQLTFTHIPALIEPAYQTKDTEKQTSNMFQPRMMLHKLKNQPVSHFQLNQN